MRPSLQPNIIERSPWIPNDDDMIQRVLGGNKHTLKTICFFSGLLIIGRIEHTSNVTSFLPYMVFKTERIKIIEYFFYKPMSSLLYNSSARKHILHRTVPTCMHVLLNKYSRSAEKVLCEIMKTWCSTSRGTPTTLWFDSFTWHNKGLKYQITHGPRLSICLVWLSVSRSLTTFVCLSVRPPLSPPPSLSLSCKICCSFVLMWQKTRKGKKCEFPTKQKTIVKYR